jgi:TP901 family phage tail tape measure protein
MTDIQSNIDINIDTSDAISSIKDLQRQIAVFHQSLRASGSAANSAISDNLAKNLINSINATKQFSASQTTVKSSTEAFTESLEKNKMSMGQYFKYAAGSTKTFGRLFSDEFNTIQKVAESRVKTLQTQFIKLGREAGGAVKAIKVRPLALDMENLSTRTAIAAQKQQLMNQLLKQGSTNLLNFGKNTQWAGRQLMVGFTVPLTMLGSTAAKVFMDMEKSVIAFKRVYGDMNTTVADTNAMVSQLQSLAQSFTKYGVAVSDTMEMAAKAAAMGKMGADLTAQVAQATKLAVLGGVEQSQALETTVSLTNAFGVAADQLSGKIDFLNAVENQTVTSIEDLTIAVPKAGPVIKQLGGNVEDLAFFLTAMKEGGINASEGANALKSGLAAMINPTKQASEFLQGFGINLTGIVEANKGNIKNTVVSFAQALDKLDPLNRARAIEQLFGKFQFARISTLFQNITKEGSQAQKVLGLTSATSQELAILSEREMKKVEDSPMFKFQKAIEDIKVKLVPLGEAFLKMVTPVIEFGTKLLDQFNAMGDGVKNFIMGTIAVLGGLAPAAIMAFGLIANGIANLIKAGNFLRNIFIRAGQGTSILGQQTQYMSSEQLEAAAAAASLNQAHQNLTQQFTAEASAVRKLISAYNDAIAAQSKFSQVPTITRTRTGKSGGGTKTTGYSDGIISVPGPKGAGDIVPAMLAPGEAVIPADVVSKNRGFIARMMSGKIPGFKNSNISQTGTTLDVGGQTYQLPRSFKKEDIEVLRNSANHLHSKDPEAAAIAMTMLEQTKGMKDSGLLSQFARNAMLSHGGLAGAAGSETLRLIFPEDEFKKLRQDILESSRGNPQKALTSLDELKLDPSRQKDYDIAKSISKAMYEEIVSGESKSFYEQRAADNSKAKGKTVTVEDLARSITGYDPNKENAHWGVERGHRAESGLLKTDKRMWTSSFTSFDPRVENGFLSILSDQKGAQHQMVMKAIDNAILQSNDAGRKKSLESLKTKIMTNASFNEEERIAFSHVVEELSKNKDHYVRGLPEKEIKKLDNFFQTSKLLSIGYKAADLENPKNKSYRVGTPEETKQKLAELKNAKANEMEAIRKVAIRKLSPAQITKRIFRFADGVVSVPGPKGAGDVVPAMLSPGESVIPARMSKKYAPLIHGMVNDNLPGYDSGFIPPGVTPPPGYDPFGESNYNFNVPKSRGKMGSFLDSGKDLAKGFAANIVPVSKKLGAGFVDKINDSKIAASLGSKLFGQDITTTSGATFRDGVELRQDKNGRDYYVQQGRGRISADEASQYQVDTNAAMLQQKQDKKQMRQQRSGRIAQAGMGLSMAVGMATAVPGAVGQAAQKAIGPISAMTAAMSLIPGPWGAAAGAVAGVGVAIYQMQQDLVNFRNEAADTAKTMSSGAEAMKNLSIAAGTVSPTEAMDKIRQDARSPYNIKTGKNTFGGSYLQSEQGKSMVSSVQKTEILSGKKVAVSDMATQLSQAVATNVLTKEQAASIAYNLGAELKDHDFSLNVLGKMTSILGPDGQDLAKDPLKVAALITEEKQSSLGKVGDVTSTKGLLAQTGKDMWIDGRQNYTEAAAAEAKYAQGFQDILDMGKENLDNLELAHRKKVEELTLTGDLNKLNKENADYLAKKNTLQQTAAKAVKVEYDYIDSLQNSSSTAVRKSAEQIVDNIENNKEKLFDGLDEASKNAAQLAVRNISDNPNLRFAAKATLTAGITVENVADYQKLQTLFPVDKNTEIWDKVAKVSVKYGSGAQEQLIKLGGFFDGTDKGKKTYDLFIDYVTNNKDGQAVMDDLTEITRVSDELLTHPIKMSEFIDDTGKPTEKLTKVRAGIKAVSDAIAKNKGKAIKYSFETTGFKLTKDQADYFNSLPADQQKVYTTTYLTVQESITKDDINTWKAQKIAAAGGGATVKTFYDSMSATDANAAMSAEAAYKATEALTKGDALPPGSETPPSGGGGTTNPLDDLLKKLKQIRQAAVNATGGLKELTKWMKSGALEKKGGGLVFNGMNQQMQKNGYNKDFVDFLSNADAAVRKTYMNISKSGVVTLTKEGVKLQNLFNALKIGEYQQSVQATVASAKQELDTRKELLATGMSYKDAVEAGKDTNLAEAIAAIKASTNIKDKNAAIKQTIELYKEQKAALESTKTAEDKFNEAYDEISKKFDADKTKITLDFEIKTAGDKKVVAQAQSDIDAIRYKIDDYNAGLTRLEPLEEAINKKYDERKDALDKVREMNQKIADQQKGQLDLADALSKGDIAAAAKAAQEMRSQDAQNALDVQSKNLDLARQQELKSLQTDVNGTMMTREEIEKSIKKYEMDIFDIEESRLEPAQRNIALAEEARDKALTALDDQKREWDILKNKIDLAKTSALDYAEALKAAQALAAQAIADNSKPKAQVDNTPKDSTSGLTKEQKAVVDTYTSGIQGGRWLTEIATQIGNGNQQVIGAFAPGLLNSPSNSSNTSTSLGNAPAALAGLPSSVLQAMGYYASGGFAKGTDTIPAMLTPGEFVVSKYGVKNFGVDGLKAINSGTYNGDSVYNYNLSVNMSGSNLDANDVADTVIAKIRQIDSKKIRGNRF